MAIYHLHVQAISRASGRSATGAAAYRAGEVIVEARTGEVHDYTRKRGVLHSEILAPAGAPDWVFDRAELWNRVELGEKRKDAQVCRELDIALPCELSSRQRLDLIHGYVKRNFVQHGMVADVCLHAPGRGEDNQNFHAHVMLTMRRIEGDGFGKKAREWNSVPMLESWRSTWAKAANEALAKAGHDARIDHRSHQARGLDEVPGQHHGPAVAGIVRRGEVSDVAERQASERAARESALLEAHLAIAKAQAAAADAELQELEAQAEREAQDAAAAEQAARAAQEAQERAQAEQDRQRVAEAERKAQEAARAAQERELLAQVERQRQAEQQRQEAERQRLAALDKARRAHEKAELQLAQAIKAEGAAETAVERLKNARDRAILGQQEAGKSLLKTAQALVKVPGWIAAINAYDAAVGVLKTARMAVQAARQAVTNAWARVLTLDPVERAAIEARYAAIQASQAAPVPARARARQQAPRAAPALRQVQDDDQEPQPQGPAPGM